MMLRAHPEYGGLVHIAVGGLLEGAYPDHSVTLTYCFQTALVGPKTPRYENAFFADVVDVAPTCLTCVVKMHHDDVEGF